MHKFFHTLWITSLQLVWNQTRTSARTKTPGHHTAMRWATRG
ncbi:hypothetical protein SAMN05444817_101255 [Corynebacterium appendicis CIP 107643]|uniref:Uncharacterized protein n=1 Tax=Corynebacterium appendicis CIP 107643 TaxID=1161099 RepID=A0A1N7IQ08_9CORY|nr:hypothetical protein CAPP_00190 [Corynebacterium appendicis CIP 107643]SIS39165.1 hypothetical protein SAMN05444817_101255 [Corynebacterium appendicis CIP 107643]